MKDTIQEIQKLTSSLGELPDYYSDIVIDLFDSISQQIKYGEFYEKISLYEVENLLSVFNPALKKDIEILEQLKEKLNRLNKMSL